MESFDPREWVVVMPSIRTINLDYLAPIPPEVKVLVVDDSNGNVAPNRENMEVFRYEDYRRVLGEDEDLIPRKTDTCRSFGFFVAWRRGYRYIVTLDDDCMTHPGFLDGYSLLGQRREVASVAGNPWYNTLDNLELKSESNGHIRWYARGFPYGYRVEPPESPVLGTHQGRVVCHMGLWLNVPDINGLDKIERPVPTGVAVRMPLLAVAPGTNFSLCIMNVGFLAELVPAFYQLPMNVGICNARLDRFGDIWSGYILKKLADVRGDLVTLGEPAVTHTKSGNTVREMRVEHFGNLLENYFYQFVDEAVSGLRPASYGELYATMAENLAAAASREKLTPAYRAFFRTMSDRMVRWSKVTASSR